MSDDTNDEFRSSSGVWARVTGLLDLIGGHAHWLIRISLALTFIIHGIPKVPPDAFVERTGLPDLIGWMVGLGEVAAGVAILAGPFIGDLFTRLAGLIIVAIMIGAIVLVHGKNGWIIQNNGMEYQALILAVGVLFLTRGNKV